MGRIIENTTGDVVYESDDPGDIKAHADQLEVDAREAGTPGPVYAIEGFDSGELETGEVRDDAPHDLPPDEPPYDPPDEPPAEAPEPAE